ncbi:MAG: Lipid-A-disaccharide synthase [Planctomycetes bacterium ADurb.Bin412]|nr:MAG: Lipid-A-disaccharide synthase [Planctomycetes bacterium ADurb.Bin412]
MQEQIRTIFISAAEASGDMHAAALIRQIRHQFPNTRCEGLGGPRMAEAGCCILEDLVSRSAMLTHAVAQVPFYFKLLRRIKEHFNQQRPDMVILVDSFAWNSHVGKAARRLGIPVLYYIPPQLWAWGAWRVGKLRRCADKVACIFPFEQDWFTRRHIDANYVGHPLFDDSHPVDLPKLPAHTAHFPTIALLPGSRGHEIDRLWQPMQTIARRIKDRHPQARFQTAAPDSRKAELLRASADENLNIDIRHMSIEAATRYADLALVASGTATLEVAAQSCPMVVLYHVNWLHWYLAGKWLVKTPHISLVNILAKKELVPEFIPFRGRTSEVAAAALAILEDDPKRQALRQDLKQLLQPILTPGAARHVTEIMNQMFPIY